MQQQLTPDPSRTGASGISVTPSGTSDLVARALGRTHLVALSLSLLAAFGCSTSALAFNFLPLGEGTLSADTLVQAFQFTIGPGETVPWHFHPGQVYGIIVSGTLTEDEGCGLPLKEFKTGSAFAEAAGHVHRVFNFGTEPVVITFTFIVPTCFVGYTATIFVDSPRCEGNSEKSHLEAILPCSP